MDEPDEHRPRLTGDGPDHAPAVDPELFALALSAIERLESRVAELERVVERLRAHHEDTLATCPLPSRHS